MRLFTLLTTLSSMSLATACTDVSANFNLQSEVADFTVDFLGPCEGSGSQTDEFGTSTWTKMNSEAGCQVIVAWDGQLVPTDTIRQRIEDDAGDAVKEVSIDRLQITVRSVRLRDAGGTVKTPMVTAFDGQAEVVSNALYAIDRSDVDALLNLTESVQRELIAPNPILDALNASLNDGAAFPAHADLTIIVPPETLEALQIESENPHRITVTHDFEIEATATVGL